LFAARASTARGEPHGVRAFSVHPGSIITDLMRSMSQDEQRQVMDAALKISPFKTTEQGAATSVWCATQPRARRARAASIARTSTSRARCPPTTRSRPRGQAVGDGFRRWPSACGNGASSGRGVTFGA